MALPAEITKEISGDPRLASALKELESLMIPGEELAALAVQRRVFALTHRRMLVAATSGRLIGMRRGLFGSFHPTTVRWQDLKEARLDVGMLGARLVIAAFGSPDLAIAGNAMTLDFPGLRKTQAEGVYRVCQAQDQAWREKRRVRELEEMRAKSGGIQLGFMGASTAAASAAGEGQEDVVTRLEHAKNMLDKGLISDSEYEALKARIVNTL
jgi:hypothetical protein